MKRSVFAEKLLELSVRSEKLETESKVVLESSTFLADEASKYLAKADDITLSIKEREKSHKVLMEIYKRMDLELKRCDRLDIESIKCREEVTELFKQKREEGLENEEL